MADIILYMTKSDTRILREWINADSDVYWIVMDSRNGFEYRWRAVKEISDLLEQGYSLWHTSSGPLNIPSGNRDVPDIVVEDPFTGWNQVLSSKACTAPFFGGNLPGPFHLRFRELGSETTNSLARSDFTWPANYYASIGKPADPETLRWWRRLDRFIKANSVAIPWPYPNGIGKRKAYVFPDAHRRILDGYLPDANP